jgi:GntR family transcriptional repressor for pyruvate dehydrogenase complex
MNKVFKKISDKNIHRYAENQLELLILNGVFKPNEKLPAERILSEQLNISRPTLRKAISHLNSLEILVVKRGGGTYVSNFLGDINTIPLTHLFKKYNKAALDFFELRYDVEGQAAYYAATRATKSDKKILTICLDNLKQTNLKKIGGKIESQADLNFHLAIVDSSHNIALLHFMKNMYSLADEGIFFNQRIADAKKGLREKLLDQHILIYKSIMNSNPDEAKKNMQNHILYIRDAVLNFLLNEEREEISFKRLNKINKRNL